jgi:hypothetical protein
MRRCQRIQLTDVSYLHGSRCRTRGRRGTGGIATNATGRSPTGRSGQPTFSGEQAPCGRTVNGDHFVDEDGDGLVIRDEYYSCGCRRIRHEYHDGSIDVRAIRHDGKPVKDQIGPDHGC